MLLLLVLLRGCSDSSLNTIFSAAENLAALSIFAVKMAGSAAHLGKDCQEKGFHFIRIGGVFFFCFIRLSFLIAHLVG